MKTSPPFLSQGAHIGICCPSGFLEKHKVLPAQELFLQNGWTSSLGSTFDISQNYFSAPDNIRLQDLQNMLDNPNIHAIVFGRGGYGISRIIDRINWSHFFKSPKWICGYSDITLLHTHINHQIGFQSLHSPMAAALSNPFTTPQFIDFFIQTLQGKNPSFSTPNTTPQFSVNGQTQAEIVGGNLSLLVHAIGSPSEIQTHNKILFIEDTDEYQYNIDRMFLQLIRAQKIHHLKGLIIGGFTNTKDTSRPFGQSLFQMIKNHLADCHFPIAFNFPIGHQPHNLPVKIGAQYFFEVSSNTFSLSPIN